MTERVDDHGSMVAIQRAHARNLVTEECGVDPQPLRPSPVEGFILYLPRNQGGAVSIPGYGLVHARQGRVAPACTDAAALTPGTAPAGRWPSPAPVVVAAAIGSWEGSWLIRPARARAGSGVTVAGEISCAWPWM